MKPIEFILYQKDIHSLSFPQTGDECYYRATDVEILMARYAAYYDSKVSFNFSISVVTFHFKPKKNKPSYYATVWNDSVSFEEFVKNTIGRLKETRMWRKRTLVRIDYPIAGKIKDI